MDGWMDRKHRILSVQIYVCEKVQDTMSATPATWSSASSTHGEAYHKTSKLLVDGERGCVHVWRQIDITL